VRAVVQRVASARVTVDGRDVGAIGRGLAVLVGIATGDSRADGDWMLDKVLDLRIFENDAGKFDRSLRDVGGALLLVSQFTLLADTRKGRRPSFTAAARPEDANPLYEYMLTRADAQGVPVAGGAFGAHMQVALVNDGPVTIVLDSRDR
jgi:D-tyrosyl-tRNA(Tyr) deacylase